ncbi:glycosyltransferase family 20 protein [Apiospora arundinis]|uniref:Glycosyltransferase family 20 protein n=1 Tax=Apiospora arundinis TaxID=335852 RepID=A0ABR2IWK8_9PEZI
MADQSTESNSNGGLLDAIEGTKAPYFPRPSWLDRSETGLPPHERPSVTKVPVTPGIHLTTYQPPNEEDGTKGRSTTPGYFTANPAQHDGRASQTVDDSPLESSSKLPGARVHSPSTPAARSVTSGQDVMRRLHLVPKGQCEFISQMQPAVPELALTGNLISATFTLPYALKYNQSGDWKLGIRRGQSSLFDALSYLSSEESPWDQTVVAWTGEIETNYGSFSPPDAYPGITVNMPSLNPLSAPVPIDNNAPPVQPLQDGIFISRDHQVSLEQQLSHDKRMKTIPIWLADNEEMTDNGIALKDQSRWRQYAEHELYALFHYRQHEPTDGRLERMQWTDYYRMNLKFADKIMDVYKPGDVVVIHDFYLMLLPSMLRQRAPNMYISFYLHTPFPTSEFLRCLPRRKEVLQGVLGANLVGFQSYSYSRHFLNCCTRILDFPSDSFGVDVYGSRVEVGVFPIGIDFAKVEKLAWNDSVDKAYNDLKKLYKGKKIVVGRDRLDSGHGVTQKLMAFERFLELYPHWREKVVLIQVTSPKNTEDDSENKVTSRVNELVTRINGSKGSLTYSPVQHYPQYLSQEEYFALLRAADIGLITSVRDGLNTTSLEYVVCQRESHGPLILSEFSGTAGFLPGAIHINPWDLSGVAKKIDHALTMPSDQRQHMQNQLYNHVAEHNVQSWVAKFLFGLVDVLARN